MSKDEKKAAIFFGRKTCPDCVEAIHKIDAARKKIKKEASIIYQKRGEGTALLSQKKIGE